MDMDSLKMFLSVQRTGSLTAAANSLYMTQPSLGRRISCLEKELGVPLFHRGKGQAQVKLPPEGEAFSDIARRAGDVIAFSVNDHSVFPPSSVNPASLKLSGRSSESRFTVNSPFPSESTTSMSPQSSERN